LERPKEESQEAAKPSSRFSEEELDMLAEKVVKRIEVTHACPFSNQQVYFMQNFSEMCKDIRSEVLKVVIKFVVLLIVALIVIVFATKIFPLIPHVE
jgi:hypothetical protein